MLISLAAGPPFAQIAKRCGYRNKTHLSHAFTETIRAATGEAREKLDELASHVIMDKWTAIQAAPKSNSLKSKPAASN